MTFAVSQTWSDHSICLLATDYVSVTNSAPTCEPRDVVPPGEVAVYTAKCVEGVTVITVYVQDTLFGASNSVTSIPERCSPIASNEPNTVSYEISIPCEIESAICEEELPPICEGKEDMNIVVEDFTGGDDDTTNSWLYGSTVPEASGYLQAPEGGETSKSFAVPRDANALFVNFAFEELKDVVTNVTVRIQETYLNLGAFDASISESQRDGYLGDIRSIVTSVDETTNQVQFIVPLSWYIEGRLSISFGSGIGVTEFRIDAVCSDTLSPSGSPSESPSDSPTRTPSTQPSRAPVQISPSSAPSYDCIPDIVYTLSGNDTAYSVPPIKILKQDGDNVTFAVSQSWSENKVCLIATDYVSATDASHKCDPRDGVPPGEFAVYTAKCVEGVTVITVYVQDFIFAATSTVDSVPDRCSPIASNEPNTVSYEITIPCEIESELCEEDVPPICDGTNDMAIIAENYSSGELDTTKSWLYGLEGTLGPISFVYAESGETTQSFSVPKDASALLVNIVFHELQGLENATIRIQGSYLNLGSFEATSVDAPRTGFLGDIRATVSAVDETSNQVQLIVPSSWYTGGRLTVAIGSGIGVTEFGIEAVCSETGAPTTAPGSTPAPQQAAPSATPVAPPTPEDCVPDIVYIPSSNETSYSFPPIKILKQEGQNVTFAVSQTWSEDDVCLIATDYVSVKDDAPTCDPRDNVPPGEYALYTAKCVDGLAVITMYVQDKSFLSSSTVDNVPERCSPIASSQPNTISYEVAIPCQAESEECEVVVPSIVCDGSADMNVVTEENESGLDATWLFGTTKTFVVPSEAASLIVKFTFEELATLENATLRIQEHHLNLGPFDSSVAEALRKGYLGDVQATISSVSDDTNLVQLVIPKSWYSTTGRLTFSFGPGMDISSFSIDAVCSEVETQAPSSPPATSSPSGSPVTSPPLIDCVPHVVYTPSSEETYDYPPIQILKHRGEKVTFSVSQTWSDSRVCLIATDYVSADSGSPTCDPRDNVAPGEFATYSAQCVDGFAVITMYVQDTTFLASETVESVPDRCSPLAANAPNTVSYEITIPCELASEDCSDDEPAVCDGSDDMNIATEDFAGEGVESWLYGSKGSAGPLSYLYAEEGETTKTFSVPTEASALFVIFDFHELEDLSKLLMRVQDHYLNLGAFGQQDTESHLDGYLGDIRVVLSGTDHTENHATLIVPPTWYPTGRLTISFPPGVGVENFRIDAVCSSTSQPSSKPTSAPSKAPTTDCVPNIEYEPSSEETYDFPPIEILKHQGDKVTFTVSQTWSDSKVCLIATDYVAATTGSPTCDAHDNVPAGEFALYNAKCVDGFAVITMYVQDSLFPATDTVPMVPQRCSPIVSNAPNTISYEVTIPCELESETCEDEATPLCQTPGELSVVSDDTDSWFYGSEGPNGLYTEGTEMSKAFGVPTNSDSVVVSFTVHELDDLSSFMVRVQDHYLNLGSFNQGTSEAAKEGFLGDIEATVAGTAPTVDEVTLTIPASWYQSGRLSIAFASGVAIENFSIDATCSSTAGKPSNSFMAPTPSSGGGKGDGMCPCDCSGSDSLDHIQDWIYPGLPATSLAGAASPAFFDSNNLKGTVPCMGLAESALKPRIAMPCDNPETVYYLVQDKQSGYSKLTALKLENDEWSYVGGSRYVKYDASRMTGTPPDVKIQTSVDYQNFDLQARGDEVCMLWSDASKTVNGAVPNSASTPLVYCYSETTQKWREIGWESRIGKEADIGGDVELILPGGCDCPELSNYYFVIVGRAASSHLNTVDVSNRAVVWYYNSDNAGAGWQPLGGDSARASVLAGASKDAQLAFPTEGNFKCMPHAVVSDNDAAYSSNKHLVFARFQAGSATSSDPLGYKNGQWQALASLSTTASYVGSGSTTIKESVNDLVFTRSGIPAVGWVDGANNNFAYLSVWMDYPTAAASDRNGFEVAGRATGKYGSIPPVWGPSLTDKPAYNLPEGLTIDAYKDVIFVAITDNGVAGSSNAGKKIFISYLNLMADPEVKNSRWNEYETTMSELLPQSQDTTQCSDGLTKMTNGDAQNHIKISCKGDIYVAHIIAKDTISQSIASLAVNGLPDLSVVVGRRRDEEVFAASASESASSSSSEAASASASAFYPADEPGMDAEDGAYYCLSNDFPCEGGEGMVHVCHYSARLGYQTFCIPEADSEVLRFYKNDYCGPCVGGYGGINIE